MFALLCVAAARHGTRTRTEPSPTAADHFEICGPSLRCYVHGTCTKVVEPLLANAKKAHPPRQAGFKDGYFFCKCEKGWWGRHCQVPTCSLDSLKQPGNSNGNPVFRVQENVALRVQVDMSGMAASNLHTSPLLYGLADLLAIDAVNVAVVNLADAWGKDKARSASLFENIDAIVSLAIASPCSDVSQSLVNQIQKMVTKNNFTTVLEAHLNRNLKFYSNREGGGTGAKSAHIMLLTVKSHPSLAHPAPSHPKFRISTRQAATPPPTPLPTFQGQIFPLFPKVVRCSGERDWTGEYSHNMLLERTRTGRHEHNTDAYSHWFTPRARMQFAVFDFGAPVHVATLELELPGNRFNPKVDP